MVEIISTILILAVYFFPTLAAYMQYKKNTNAIFVLNLFTGWTGIGWIIALVWGVCKD